MSAVSLRRARPGDLDFLLELFNDPEVERFMSVRSARERGALLAEIERSEQEPEAYGRLVIELDGEPAGSLAFEVANGRSRIARLGGLAVHPRARRRGVGHEAARQLQRHLLLELGFHRLELEVYGFNEQAQRHAERAGYIREGVKRRAYDRHGNWADGVLYALLSEDLLLAEHIDRFNAGVRSGDFGPMLELFAEDAELRFEGVPLGPYVGRPAIAKAYVERPPDGQIELLETREENAELVARFAWARDRSTGTMRLARLGDLISRLVISFGEQPSYDAVMTRYLHTMYRITDPESSRAFYEALGLEFRNEMDIVRGGQREATNYFFGVPGQPEELELTFNHDGRTYDLGTGYGHIAIGVDDLDGTLARLKETGIEPEREPYTVSEGGSRLCFVRDPDGYRIELIDRREN
ncbi:MAG: GNAT family N-acetyltransferase [Gaiellaceae bacterium]